jgi:hypothetical protein
MNHVVWHTSAHQPPLAGRPGWVYYAGTHLNLNVPWWPMAKAFLSYLARASFLLQQGQPVSDVLYYYGDQGYNFVLPKKADAGLGAGYEYDVTNADVLTRRLAVQQGRLALPEGTRYEVLVLPEGEEIDLEVLKKVETLVGDGATVVGRKPVRSTGYSGYPGRDVEVRALAEKLWGNCGVAGKKQVKYGRGRVVCGMTPGEVLRQRGVGPDFTYRGATGAQLDFAHRTTREAEIYFVHNKQARREEVEAEFRVKGKQPELWDAATGARRDVRAFEATEAGTRFSLRLEPEGSVFVVFRRAAKAGGGARPQAAKAESMAVDGPWSVRFVEGPAAPEPATMTSLRPWTASADPREKYFSGIAEYETEVTVPAAWVGRELVLDLGEVWAVAEVRLNGKEAGVAWKRPFAVDVTDALRAGKNRLQVRVANNWVNRLVGDGRAAAGSARVTKTNVLTTGANVGRAWKDVEPRASGLMGPVRLVERRE